ncbi:MAG: TIGR00374 family protein, partial [Candidatus Cloacimonetes bacterium]|nr:TIGR00374 family protein [Candidatus Cloacimonadota bacterium]
MKKIIIFAVIGLFLVIIWLKLIDVEEMFSYFKNINIYYLILTVFFVLLAISLRAIRWHFITKR